MSTLVLDTKIDTLNEIGNLLDDALETAKVDALKCEGAQSAFLSVAKSLSNLGDVINVDVQAGKLTEEHAAVARAWVSRALQVCDNLSRNSANTMFLAKGAVTQNMRMIAKLKEAYDLERARKARLTEAPAEPAAPVAEEAAEVRKSPAPRSIKETRLTGAADPVKPARNRGKKKA
jgi:hypothetical protein